MIAAILNRFWLLSGYRNYLRFLHKAHSVEAVQRNRLTELLHSNRHTHFGKAFGFAKMAEYEQYADAVPLMEDYDTLAPYLQKMAEGQANVLFPGKPQFFETTSGSTGKSKLIPYNTALKSALETGIQVWMNNLYRQDKAIFDGRAYWSVSPALKKPELTPAGIPVGNSGDTDYFNPLSALLLKNMLVASPKHDEYETGHEFYVKSWRYLLSTPKLSFISVWSPNFLIRMHRFLQVHHEEILRGMPISTTDKQVLKQKLSGAFTMHHLFPKLRLLSCWTQAQAAMWMPELKAILGEVAIQGKGLLSTEGLVTIPFGESQHVLAYTGHFFEFRKSTSGQIYPAWQLETGNEYEVILSTGAGLYRYCTGDLVQCTGFLNSIPCLQFLGRGSAVCDMVGEKLYEASLPNIFQLSSKKNDMYKNTNTYSWDTNVDTSLKPIPNKPLKMFVYAWKQAGSAGYKLLLEGNVGAGELPEIVAHVSSGLEENPYYAQAVAAGQLAPLTAEVYPPGFAEQLFEWYGNTRKIRDGDIKLPLLYRPGTLKDLIGY